MNKLYCSIFGHARDRANARSRGRATISTCRRCGTPMVRDGADGKWRSYDPVAEPIEAEHIAPVTNRPFGGGYNSDRRSDD